MSTHYCVPDSTRMLLQAFLGPSLAGEMLSTISKWTKESGVEWTVKRLKSLEAAAKQLRAGNRSIAKEIYQKESIKHYNGTLFPRERSFRQVFNVLIMAERQSVLKRCFAILRIGTSFRLDQVSSKQKSDALRTISSPALPLGEKARKYSLSLYLATSRIYGNQSGRIKSPDLRRLRPFSSTYAPSNVHQELRDIPYGKALHSLITTARIPESLVEKMNPDLRDLYLLIRSGGADDITTGKLAFLSEKGAKCRTIAVPNAWIQLLMEPVHTLLDGIARELPESCLHDQNKGAFFLKDHLALGREVWCFDLSAATDTFPLSLQLSVLKGLGLEEYCSVISDFTNSWLAEEARDNDPGRLVNYSVGQPMGMYGSFPLFHLTHILLLKLIVRNVSRQERRKIKNSFKVLGDDVIIVDKSVAREYEDVIRELNVNISSTKSINSDSMGEFAGFIGVKTKDSVAVFRPFKHGIQGNENGPLNLINALGSKCHKLPHKWGSWYDAFSHTLSWRNPDLSPIVTCNDDVGILPDKISRGKLESLIAVMLNRNPDFISSLDYEFGDPENHDWFEVVRFGSYALLGEQCTGPLGLDIGIDVTQPEPIKQTLEQQINSDPLVKESLKVNNLRKWATRENGESPGGLTPSSPPPVCRISPDINVVDV